MDECNDFLIIEENNDILGLTAKGGFAFLFENVS